MMFGKEDWEVAFQYEEEDDDNSNNNNNNKQDAHSSLANETQTNQEHGLDFLNEDDDLISSIKNPKQAIFDNSKVKIFKKRPLETSNSKPDDTNRANMVTKNQQNNNNNIDAQNLNDFNDIANDTSNTDISSFDEFFNDDVLNNSQQQTAEITIPLPAFFKQEADFSNNLYLKLCNLVLNNIVSYSIYYFLHSIRNNLYVDFIKAVLPLLRFSTKKDKPGSFWTNKNIALAESLQNSYFQPLKIFKNKTGNQKEDFNDFLPIISAFITAFASILQIESNETFKNLTTNLNTIITNAFKDNNKKFTSLQYFNNGYEDFTDIESYFDAFVQVGQVQTWFSDAVAVYDKLLWNGIGGGAEANLKNYYAKKLYLHFGILNYLIKHPSLKNDLKDFQFEDFADIDVLDTNSIKLLDLDNVQAPLLLLFYNDRTSNISLKLNETNNFISFIDLINLTNESFNLSKNSSYADVLKKSVDATLSKQKAKFYITYLPHILNDDDDKFNFETMTINNNVIDEKTRAVLVQNNFVLQLTTYNTTIRASSLCLLIDDNQTDSEVAKDKDLANTNNLKIVNLEKSNNISNLTAEIKNTIYNTKASLTNESLLLKKENALISFKEVLAVCDKIMDNFYKNEKIGLKE